MPSGSDRAAYFVTRKIFWGGEAMGARRNPPPGPDEFCNMRFATSAPRGRLSKRYYAVSMNVNTNAQAIKYAMKSKPA